MPVGIYIHKRGYKRPSISDEWRKNLIESHKGQIPWNKGKHTGFAPWLGKKRSEETKEKISVHRKGKLMGTDHFAWKGDKAEYRALHQRLGKAVMCDYCGDIGGKHGCHWANLTGKYADPSDYLSLCPKHHKQYDMGKLFIQDITESLRVNIFA